MAQYYAICRGRRDGAIGASSLMHVSFDAQEGEDVTLKLMEQMHRDGFEWMPGSTEIRRKDEDKDIS